MKLYGKQRIRQNVDRRIDLAQPDKDAIIWSVNTSQHYAYVKIQGSNTQIKAHYPANWYSLPNWLKPGNAVRLRHKRGKRGYIEIVGSGRAIPSPVGDNETFPTASTPSDAILTGLLVRETSPVATMAVAVQAGTYRISGVTYTFAGTANTYIPMHDPAYMIMTAAGTATMGEGEYRSIALDAAPASGYCRYDLIVIGIDGVVDVVKGTAATYAVGPTAPSVPANHLQLAKVFIRDNMTIVENADINRLWTSPYASELDFGCVCTDCELAWSAVTDNPTCVVTLTVLDQYGNPSTDANGALVNVTMYGTGTFKCGQDATYQSNGATGHGNINGSGVCQFTYKRDQTAMPENDPVFIVTVNEYFALQCVGRIQLNAATTTTTTTQGTMEKLLTEILAELKYQTKLMETIFDNKRANGKPDINQIMETATQIIMNMPMIKAMGFDQEKLRTFMQSNKEADNNVR